MNSIKQYFSSTARTQGTMWLLELALLSLLIITLPSLEAPKNIFLVAYVLVASIRQYTSKTAYGWELWDWIFLAFIVSGLLSAAFAGFAPGDEWKGFRVLVTAISVGWLLSRSTFTRAELTWLFAIAVLSTVPPLLWGLFQYYGLHSKHDLQLRSVGHVNHSAIYLSIIFGATLGACLSSWKSASTNLRAGLLSLSVLFYLSLIIGQSRGALGIGFLLAIMLILLLINGLKWKLIGLSVLVIPAILAVALRAGVVEKQEINEKNNNVLSFRDRAWNVSLEASRFYPLLGIGLDNWKFIKPDDIKDSVEKRHKVYNPDDYFFAGHSHNVYLTALVERGILGLSTLLFLMVMWIRQIIKSFNLTRNSTQAGYLWAGSFSAWFTTFGVGLVNTTFHHEHGILACLFLGLYLAYCRINRANS